MPRKKKEEAAETAAEVKKEEEIMEVPDDFASGYPEDGGSLGAFEGLSMGGFPSAAAVNESLAGASSGDSSKGAKHTERKISDEQAEHERKATLQTQLCLLCKKELAENLMLQNFFKEYK